MFSIEIFYFSDFYYFIIIDEQATRKNQNSDSINGKLNKLDKNFTFLYHELIENKEEVIDLKRQKDVIQDDLIKKTTNVKQELSVDLEKVEKEMKLHFIKQKQENVELQKKLSELKTKKTVLQNQLIGILNKN